MSVMSRSLPTMGSRTAFMAHVSKPLPAEHWRRRRSSSTGSARGQTVTPRSAGSSTHRRERLLRRSSRAYAASQGGLALP
jgi:hypothetical protein